MYCLKSVSFILAAATIASAQRADTATASCTANCYNHCQDVLARGDARFINPRNCLDTEISPSLLAATPATRSSSTSNFLSPGTTSTATPTTAMATDQTGNMNEDAVSDVNHGLIEGQPGKSFSGLESHNDMNQSSKESVAFTIRATRWIGLLGLVIGLPMTC